MCLSPDLEVAARGYLAKRVRAGDAAVSDFFLNGVGIQTLDPQYRQPGSRLVVLAHGNPTNQTNIFDGNENIICNHETLADHIERWLGGGTIKRIVLNVCYGGGVRGGRVPQSMNWTLPVDESFAYALATYCGYAETIAAFTDVVNTTTFTNLPSSWLPDFWVDLNPYMRMKYKTVGETRRYKVLGDKVLIEPDPEARPERPREPKGWAFPASHTAESKPVPF
jgi:hypothetical protein